MLETGAQQTERIPLIQDERGTVLIGETRVTLDVVMEAYDQGATPEQIVQRFGELRLDDVYAVITYYLRHTSEVRAYLADRARHAQELREAVESDPGNRIFRERLLRCKRDRRSGTE